MFEHNSNYQLLWEVSDRHEVLVGADVHARDIYHMTDQIISAYVTPKQIKAQFFTKNKVVRVYYADR
ncbi:hypothetical protein KIH87_17890 [Paraneptunicella aestuarii]|uniref:toxin co-regulated pilus biosynthesis Q family protein n=1 Tax=Paraneptunicella aestuarii TaxID=2831148 RepID=UPI001E2E7B3B|nr:toxin co-regulated pilus biosynthesis Q family protein [Paraneptunicella aestuarii]UAA38518.1 hypothetical protein KIH87_17890 [Paraneptunicella aestuarii]